MNRPRPSGEPRTRVRDPRTLPTLARLDTCGRCGSAIAVKRRTHGGAVFYSSRHACVVCEP